MKSFKFVFKPKSISKPPKVIDDNCKGKIVLSDDNIFRVESNNNLFLITESSFNSKGKKIVYSRKRDSFNNHIKVIRDKRNLCELNPKYYIPFREGLLCKGKVLLINGIKYFQIISCYSEASSTEMKDAIDEFTNFIIE